MARDNAWPPFGSDPNLPIDHQGMNDPGNDDDLPELDEDGLPIIPDDDDEDLYDNQEDL